MRFCFTLAYFQNNDICLTKQYAYLIGKSAQIDIDIFEEDTSLSLLTNVFYILLSDHLELINTFSKIKEADYSLRLSKGSLVACVQAVIRNDFVCLKQQIEVCYSKIANKKNGKWILPDLQFFEGILNNNRVHIEESLLQLATVQHKKRNEEKLTRDLFSFPALGYAKLAWLKGIKIEIDHPLIPKELLPIKPNEDYWEYDYMKQGEFICKS